MPTGATRLAGRVPAINLDQAAPIPLGLVFQLPHELAPTHISDGLGKGGMLHHVLDCQTLDHDRLVLTDELRRKLVLISTTSIGYFRMDLGHPPPLSLAVLRSVSLTGKFALSARQFLLTTRKIAGIVEALASACHNHRCEPQVNADGLLQAGKRRNVFFHQDGDKIATSGVPAHDNGRRACPVGQGTRPVDIERGVHLGERELPILECEGTSGIFGRLAVASPFKRWITGPSCKKVDVGPCEVAQTLLAGHTRDLVEEAGFCLLLKRSQVRGQLLVGQAFSLLLVGVDRQTQRPIVCIAHAAERTGEDLFLLVDGIKPIAIGAFDCAHTEIFSPSAAKTEGSRPSVEK